MKDIHIVFISSLVGLGVVIGGVTAYYHFRPKAVDIPTEPQVLETSDFEEVIIEDEDSLYPEEPAVVEDPVLPSTRSLLLQCSEYGYDATLLTPILLSIFGDGTINLDAYLDGEHNERLVFADDFYVVTIYRMYNNSYSVIVQTDDMRVYYISSLYTPEMSFDEIELLSKKMDLPYKALIYVLGNIATLYHDSHYELDPTNKYLWYIYTDLGLPVGKVHVHPDCAIFEREGEDKVVWQYYDFIEPKLDTLSITEVSEPEDINTIIESLYPNQRLHAATSIDIDILLQAYKEAGYPIYGDYTDSDKYINLREIILSTMPEFTHWYVDVNDGSLRLIDANKSTRDSPYNIQWASYYNGRVQLLH